MSRDPASPGLTFEQAAERVPFLRALSGEDRTRLRAYAQIRALHAGQPVWRQQDDLKEFTFLLEGHVKLCRPSDSGRDVILDVAGPGELLCGSAVTNYEPACCTCAAWNGPAVVIALPRRDVLALIERSPAAATVFVREATGRDRRLTQRLVELANGHVEQRVATLLLRLADQIGESVSGGHLHIPLRLSRQDLADLCGTTLETAIRTMTRLARDGIVRTGRVGPVIVDRGALEAVARGEGPAASRRG